MKSIFKIKDGDEKHWYVADSQEHARNLLFDEVGPLDDIEITLVEPSAPIKIRLIDEIGEPTVTKTASQWVESANYGCLASTSS